MKYLFLGLFSICFLAPAYSIGTYASGDILYVWAISGLNMRAQPNAQSTKVLNIDYGGKVKVVDTQLRQHSFQYTMANGNIYGTSSTWTVDGHWVKIECQGQEGYVFDAYLSKLPAMTDTPEQHPYFKLDLIKEYGKKHWGGLKEEKKESTLNFEDSQRDPDNGLSTSYWLSFQNGAYFEDFEEGYSGYVSLFVKDISLEEGFLIFNALTGYEYKKAQSDQNTFDIGMELSKQKPNELYFTSEGGGSVHIQKQADGVIIQMGGGC